MGIDPGGTTGIAVVEVSTNHDGSVFTCIAALEAKGIPEVLDALNGYRPQHIVLELFTLYPWLAQSMSWNQMHPSQVIGAVKGWCYNQKEAPVLVEQPASVRKGIKAPMLKALGCGRIVRGKDHAKDALRHALWYCWKQWPDDFVRYLRAKGWY